MVDIRYSADIPEPVKTQTEKLLGKNCVRDGEPASDPFCPSASFGIGDDGYSGVVGVLDKHALTL